MLYSSFWQPVSTYSGHFQASSINFIIVTVIKIRRLEWLEHVIRMNDTRYVKKVFEGKLEGRRGRGRPRLRWINDVEDDLTLRLLMSYIYGAPSKARNANVVYIWTYVWQR